MTGHIVNTATDEGRSAEGHAVLSTSPLSRVARSRGSVTLAVPSTRQRIGPVEGDGLVAMHWQPSGQQHTGPSGDGSRTSGEGDRRRLP